MQVGRVGLEKSWGKFLFTLSGFFVFYCQGQDSSMYYFIQIFDRDWLSRGTVYIACIFFSEIIKDWGNKTKHSTWEMFSCVLPKYISRLIPFRSFHWVLARVSAQPSSTYARMRGNCKSLAIVRPTGANK